MVVVVVNVALAVLMATCPRPAPTGSSSACSLFPRHGGWPAVAVVAVVRWAGGWMGAGGGRGEEVTCAARVLRHGRVRVEGDGGRLGFERAAWRPSQQQSTDDG